MKNHKKYLILIMVLIILFLSAVILNEKSNTLNHDINYEAEKRVRTAVGEPSTITIYTHFNMTPGKNEKEVNFSWYSQGKNNRIDNLYGCMVQIARKNEMKNNIFPAEKANIFSGVVSRASKGYFSNKVTVKGLEANTDYVYRIGDGLAGNWSEAFDLTTRDPEDFSFLFFGDAQIGAGKSIKSDTSKWVDALNKACSYVRSPAFMLSAGDQVNKADNEKEYEGFFKPVQFRNIPIVAVVGNHDAKAPNYDYHFNNPNTLGYGKTDGGSNYYFSYGDMLIIVLNSYNTNIDQHSRTIEEAVGSNPKSKWRIVAMHHNAYSLRENEPEGFKETWLALTEAFDMYDIDMVLTGHNHIYSRSHFMKGNEKQNYNASGKGSIINPDGTVYITANSSSGSKFYDLPSRTEDYIAVKSQINVPTFAEIKISKNRLSFATYRTDTMEITDSFSIFKVRVFKE